MTGAYGGEAAPASAVEAAGGETARMGVKILCLSLLVFTMSAELTWTKIKILGSRVEQH